MGKDRVVKEVKKCMGFDRAGVRKTERAADAKRIHRISIFLCNSD
jgi:hypothetical protein